MKMWWYESNTFTSYDLVENIFVGLFSNKTDILSVLKGEDVTNDSFAASFVAQPVDEKLAESRYL